MSVLDEQEQYRQHMEYVQENPLWSKLALDAINAWGRGELTLVHAVGLALQEVHAKGLQGETPTLPDRSKNIVRRTPPPKPATRILRRRA